MGVEKYGFDSGFFELRDGVCFCGVEKVHEMVFYALHFIFGDFIRDDVCPAEKLSRVAVDDLSAQSFGEVDSQLGLACARGAFKSAWEFTWD